MTFGCTILDFTQGIAQCNFTTCICNLNTRCNWMFLYFVTETSELQFFSGKVVWQLNIELVDSEDIYNSILIAVIRVICIFIICIWGICIQVNGWVNSHDSEHIVRLVGANQKKYLCLLHLQNLYLIQLLVVFAFRVSGVWVWQLNAGSETTRRTLFGRSVGRSRPKAHQCPRSRPLVLATKIPHLGFLFCHIRSRSSKKRTIGFEYWKIWRKKLLTGCCFLQPAEIW